MTKEANYDELIRLAQRLNQEKQKWHFHILTPECQFNKIKDKFSLFLENDETGETWAALFDEKPSRSEELEKLFYAGRR